MLLKHPGPVRAGEGRGQLLGAGVAIGGELQGDLQGQGGLGHLIDVLRLRRRVDRKQGREFQGRQVLAQGLVGRQGQFPQQGRGLAWIETGQPAFPGQVRIGGPQVPEAVNRGGGQVEVEGAGRQAPVAQLAGQGDQALQQGELVLEALEGRRQGAALGFALGQGLQHCPVHQAIGADAAAAEAEMQQGAIGVQVEGHREGRFALARGEGRRLVQGARQ